MKTRPKSAVLLLPLTFVLLANCNSRRGQPRELQLEKTAENLEQKAEKVLVEVKRSADEKVEEAKVTRENNGNEKAAELLEKDASVIREVGELRAEQLKEQADKVREKKE